MGILNQGCTCERCFNQILKELEIARSEWNNGVRNIVFKAYEYYCADKCCFSYGTDVYVNGFNVSCNGEDPEMILEALMEFLEIEGVNIDLEFEGE